MNDDTSPRHIGIVGYIGSVIISVLVTLVIVQAVVVEREQKGCDRRQPIFEELALTVEDAAKNAESRKEEEAFNKRVAKIRQHIVANCEDAYPPLIPFID